jgi:perosamine synthetase
MVEEVSLMKGLHYGHQSIDESDIAAVVAALKGEWLTQGPLVDEFEERVAGYVGVPYAVAFSSGTAALHGAMYAAGVESGDVVLTSPLTFAATANSVLYVKGVPVFLDIDPKTYCLDPERVAQFCRRKNPKAIAPVSYAGYPVDMKAFRSLADSCGAVLVEDACHALGAERNGVKVGLEADMTVLSFHPVKHVTTGEGGMVLTKSTEFAEKLRLFRSHGITKDPAMMARNPEGPWYTEMLELGYNYRLSDIQCALGISQMKRLDASIARRREIAARYDNAFRGNDAIAIPPGHPGHAYHLYPVWISPELRKRIFEGLRDAGIGVQVHYLPVPLHPYYRRVFGYKPGGFPNAEKIYSGEISLPMYPDLDDADVSRVIHEVLLLVGA